MTERNDIPRSEPPGDDGSGISDDDFVITYRSERVPCPECEGSGVKLLAQGGDLFEVTCAVCDDRKTVSPIFANSWLRQGV